MVMLSTVATVIASQSIITGAFSMTRQAIQLGWMPRLRITQTSEQGYGQIYIGAVNWLLMIVTVGLAIGFGKSANLAAAYGIAVSATMLITSVLLFIAMREIWGWNLLLAGAVAGVFVCVDSAFVVANSAKFFAGGYVPILLAAAVYTIMTVWHRGSLAMLRAFADRGIPIDHFMASVAAQNIPRVPGTAVFLTRILQDTPPMMVWHVKQNRALHKHVLVLRRTGRIGALDRRGGPVVYHAGGTGCLARGLPFRLHGTPGYSGADRQGRRSRLHHRSRRRDLLCRPRNDHSP